MFVKILEYCDIDYLERMINEYLSDYCKNPNYEDIHIKYINASPGTGSEYHSAMIVVREKGDIRYAE